MRTRLFLVSATSSLTLLLAGCGGDPDVKDATGDTSAKTVQGEKPSVASKDLQRYFDAVASSDPDALAAVEDVAAPGSVAAAYLQEQSDVSNAGIDAGSPYDGGTAKKVDGGYENCDDTTDEDSCVKWGDLEQVDGKLAKFTINGTDISDRISVGDGTKVDADKIASVEFLSSYKSVQSEVVFVNVRVASKKTPISLNIYDATYRDADKRQTTSTTDSTGPTELDADSTAYVSLVFKASAIGGTVNLGMYDSNFNEVRASVKTR
ncbi:MAG: hypothetical protein JWP56_1811 [Aeromicrobium sp.]|nr:hypothetical protein [Aeromicrobium sp.]